MQEITVVAVGNIASDIRFLALDSGAHRARFRLASTPRRYDRETGGWSDAMTSYVSVTCWRSLADNLASSLGKGDPVVVVGRLSVRDWERDGRKGTTVEIDATSVAPDLARGSAAYLGRRRGEPAAAAVGAPPASAPVTSTPVTSTPVTRTPVTSTPVTSSAPASMPPLVTAVANVADVADAPGALSAASPM